MKKAFATLLALVLLLTPVLSLAESTVQVTVTVKADEKALAEYMLNAGIFADETEAAEVCEPLAKLLDDAMLRAALFANGVGLELLVKDELLLDMTVTSGFASSCITSSTLIPGYAMVEKPVADEAALEKETAAALAKVNWIGLLVDVEGAFESWMGSLSQDVEYGAIMGDSFAGGACQDVYQLDDRDLAVLLMELDRIFTQRVSLPQAYLDFVVGTDVMADAAAAVHEMAVANRFSYQVAVAYDREWQDVGYSLTVWDRDKQVSTVSMGITEENCFHAVWGYGYQGKTYYLDLVLDVREEANGGFALPFTLDIYKDAARMGYRAVSADASAKVWQLTGEFAARQDETGALTGFRLTLNAADNTVTDVLIAEGKVMEDGLMDVTVSLSGSDTAAPYAVITADAAYAELSAPSTEGMREIAISDLDDPQVDAELQQVMNEAAADLAIKLFKVIPPEFLMLLM